MFNKFILQMASGSKKYITLSVLQSILALLLNLTFLAFFVYSLNTLVVNFNDYNFLFAGLFLVIALPLRFLFVRGASRAAYLATGTMKKELRLRIFTKNINLKKGGLDTLKRAELTQLALEGVEQTEMYTSVFIPQLIYSLSSVVIVFTLIAFISLKTALILLVAIPLIPLSVMVVVKFAKRLFHKYWGNYTDLGADFLDGVSGMTTLKIYNADDFIGSKINRSAERFRQMTMRVLSMQLNSITVMDAIAYGGAAVAISALLSQLIGGSVTLYEALFVTLVAAEFFLPLRALGSAFHVAMNGISAAKKIEEFLTLPEEESGSITKVSGESFTFKDVSFAYNEDKMILNNFNLEIKKGQFVALIGNSGSGKSSIAHLLTGFLKRQNGEVYIDDYPLHEVHFFTLNKLVRRLNYDSRIFKGTIKDNLLLGNEEATDEEMVAALKDSALAHFALDHLILEGGSNLSGGERQRLAVARLLLTKAKLYIFDEALSNVDHENEQYILKAIRALTKDAAVLFITHRFTMTKDADFICVLDEVRQEIGTHNKLMAEDSLYKRMFKTQMDILTKKEGNL